jgi:bifunctional UDP-N-acetylglucosamine pyrophosphorylase/glucosamine-1-phosphate N-acetyltransferase
MNDLKNEYYFKDIQNFACKEIFENCTYPWEVLARTKSFLKENIGDTQTNKCESIGDFCTFEGSYFIDEGTKISPRVTIEGPVYIGKNCKIKPGAYIRPGTIIGDNVEVGFNSEVKNSILQNGCKVASLAFVGDSMLGKSTRIGSGIILANRRFDQKNITFKKDGNVYSTETDYFGAVIGDCTRLGANSTTVPGTFIGAYTWILPTVQVRGFVPAEKRIFPMAEYRMEDNPKVELK